MLQVKELCLAAPIVLSSSGLSGDIIVIRSLLFLVETEFAPEIILGSAAGGSEYFILRPLR